MRKEKDFKAKKDELELFPELAELIVFKSLDPTKIAIIPRF